MKNRNFCDTFPPEEVYFWGGHTKIESEKAKKIMGMGWDGMGWGCANSSKLKPY